MPLPIRFKRRKRIRVSTFLVRIWRFGVTCIKPLRRLRVFLLTSWADHRLMLWLLWLLRLLWLLWRLRRQWLLWLLWRQRLLWLLRRLRRLNITCYRSWRGGRCPKIEAASDDFATATDQITVFVR